MENIHDLFKKVQDHPDFLFGTIFVEEDLVGRTMDPDFLFGTIFGDDALILAGARFIEAWTEDEEK